MAPYRQAPPPDWVGWGADVPYTPENAPLSGGYQWDEDYDDLTDPEPYAPPRSTTPPGQFLISLLEAQKRLPKPVPPGQFLASIGVHLPQPQTVLPMRPFFPPPPPLTPLEPAVDYTSMTAPASMVPPELGEHASGFGATPSRMPGEFERTVGDGVLLNTTAGANEAIYDTLGLPVDAMTWLLNQGLGGVNYATGSDLRIRDPFLGSRWFARRGASVGIPDPASIVAVTPAERIARGTGAGAAYAVAPATMVRGGAVLAGRQLGPLGQTVFGRAGSAGELGRDMAIGATAGGTGMATAELVPEPWKPTAMVVGGLLGGAAAAGVTAPGAAGTAASMVRRVRELAGDAHDRFAWPRPIDYSRGFEDDIRNFLPNAKLQQGRLASDLKLVSYHADVPLGANRSAKWWTTTDAANGFSTIDEVRQGLALLPEWGPREIVSHVTIPKGKKITAFVGEAAPKDSEDFIKYRGGSPQYRFKYFDPKWQLVQRRIP